MRGCVSFPFVLLFFVHVWFALSLDPNFIVRISLERTDCYENLCPVYKVDFFRSNSQNNASYLGESNVQKIGLWSGIIPSDVFNSLCNMIVEKRFILLNDSYQIAGEELATVYTGIEWIDADGQTMKKIVRNYGNSAPANLVLVEKEIDRIVDQSVDWKEVSNSNSSKIIIVLVTIGVILVILVVSAVIVYKRRKAKFRYMQVANEETEEEMHNPFQLHYN